MGVNTHPPCRPFQRRLLLGPGCGGTNPAWKSKRTGKGAEEWKPARGEGEHPGPLDGFGLLAGLLVSFKGDG